MSRAFACSLCCALSAAAEEPPHLDPPRLVERAEPRYPDAARLAGIGCTVLLELTIAPDGAVSDAKVSRSTAPGHGFEEAALEAARKARFEPARLDGVAVASQINYQLRFEPAPPPTLHDTAVAAPGPEYEARVEGERPFTAASATTVHDRDFLLRPRFTPEDILRVVPGLVLAQHQGGGKADQLFLRGFDADHGTDVAVSIDGVPVNLPSHAHGQGYADLHFLIPEAIERLDIRKGPYFADLGDFDTAGAVNLVTRSKFEHSSVSAMAGVFPTLSGQRTDGTARWFSGYRMLGIAAPGGDLSPYFAAEVYGTGGPFLHSENLERYNLFAKATAQLSPSSQFSLLAMAYSSSWHGSGQIPARAVDSGAIDRFGAIDPSEGGVAQRQQVIASLVTRPDARSKFSATLSAIHSDLALFSDFTFFAADPVHGDEIEQDDHRVVLYGALRYERSDGFLLSTIGAQYRADLSDVALWRVQQRARLAQCLQVANPCVSTSDRQVDAAAYVQEDLRPVPWLRVVLGLRSDTFHFNVQGLGGDPAAQHSILSPKASVVLSPASSLDLYLNFGSGFHSNDARSAVETGGAGALPRALGYEVGARTRLLDGRVELSAALWRLDLESELLWNGDTGGTAASGATRRVGLDFEGRWQVLDWLYADLDVSLATSRYKADSGNGEAVALAPPRIVTGGLTAQHPSGLRASLRARHIGTRPATQLTSADGVPPCTPSLGPDDRCYLVAESYTVFDAALAWSMRHWTTTLIAQNLSNAHYREAQFGNVSRLAGEPHAVQDIHYTPGNPLGVQLALTYEF